MHWILTKYTIKNFVLIFLVTLFVLTVVVGLFDVIELLRQAAKGDLAGFSDVLTMAILKSPQMIHIILPLWFYCRGLFFV